MNNKDKKKIEERIKNDAENIEIPESLSVDNMMAKVKNIEQNKNKFYKSAWFKSVTAVAACLLVVITVLAANGKISLYYHENYQTVYVGDEEGRSDGNYKDIYAALKSFNYSTSSSTTYGLLRDSSNYAIQDDAVTGQELEDSESISNDFYDTNEQEENVHEADVVKTDGTYIYSLDNYNSKYDYLINITKADGENTQKISEIKSEQTNDTVYISDMYVNGDKLILLGNLGNIFGEYTTTLVITYDISNPQQPEKIAQIEQSGIYNTSRMTDDVLYIISNYVLYDFTADDCVPMVRDEYVSAADVYIPENIDNASYVVVSTIDINNASEIVDTESVIMGYCNIYMSRQNLYLLDAKYESKTDDEHVNTDYSYTNIVKINCNKGNLEVTAEGKVNGNIYDSYAVDEFNNYLRIATNETIDTYTIEDSNGNLIDIDEYDSAIDEDIYGTCTWNYNESEQSNNVYVLDENLEIVGSITGIAQNEDIYSVRFIDRYGYFVTYENTDPLFAVDFATPEEPQILSKLEVSGFSNYLHVWSDNHLLGLGEERDSDSNFEGIKISMFDKSDLLNITEESKIVFKDAYYSPAQYNYKALMAAPDKNMLGLLLECQNITDNESDEYYTYSYKYVIISYDEEDGFKILFEEEADGYESNENTRGLYIDEYLYVVTPEYGIKIYNLNSYENVLNIEF